MNSSMKKSYCLRNNKSVKYNVLFVIVSNAAHEGSWFFAKHQMIGKC